MTSLSYLTRRGELEKYFDRTAVDAWARLTSDAPVSGIRATVRAGRDRMRASLLDWLPTDLVGRRILDAGCGTGALAAEAARRGADVVAIDVAPTLIELARSRMPRDLAGSIEFKVGDFLDPKLGRFDHIVAMDSLIHYPTRDVVAALGLLTSRCSSSVLFTFAPRTPALTLMHAVGRLFPRSDRAPAIEPVSEAALREAVGGSQYITNWRLARSARITSGFYMSHAMEIVRS